MQKHEEWLFKAEHDLESAKGLFNLGLFDTAIYHTQQCSEKVLKAYLVFKNQPLPKTHNLDMLCLLCIDLDSEFDNIYLDALDLNGLDVTFRYPGAQLMPFKKDVEAAIETAEKIFDFVNQKIVI